MSIGEEMKTRIVAFIFSILVLACPGAFAKHGSQGLPPGLAKNVARGKPLPPGWQKKLSRGDVLNRDIYARGKVVVPLGKDGSITIEVEGTLIKLEEKTREILDIH
jgi:hypothetical protein